MHFDEILNYEKYKVEKFYYMMHLDKMFNYYAKIQWRIINIFFNYKLI